MVEQLHGEGGDVPLGSLEPAQLGEGHGRVRAIVQRGDRRGDVVQHAPRREPLDERACLARQLGDEGPAALRVVVGDERVDRGGLARQPIGVIGPGGLVGPGGVVGPGGRQRLGERGALGLRHQLERLLAHHLVGVGMGVVPREPLPAHDRLAGGGGLDHADQVDVGPHHRDMGHPIAQARVGGGEQRQRPAEADAEQGEIVPTRLGAARQRPAGAGEPVEVALGQPLLVQLEVRHEHQPAGGGQRLGELPGPLVVEPRRRRAGHEQHRRGAPVGAVEMPVDAGEADGAALDVRRQRTGHAHLEGLRQHRRALDARLHRRQQPRQEHERQPDGGPRRQAGTTSAWPRSHTTPMVGRPPPPHGNGGRRAMICARQPVARGNSR